MHVLTILAKQVSVRSAGDDPRYRIIVAAFILFAGFLILRHREAIGEMTGYFVGGAFITGRTPACIVGAVGVLAMVLGALTLVLSVLQLLTE